KVDNTDLQILIAALGTRLIAPAGSCDINGDGIVDQNEGQVCALSQNGETDRRDLIKDGALNDRDVAALVSICVSTGCDTTAPSIVLQNPRNAAYILNQVVLANYACSDAWGIGTCAGSVASGARIDTASVGTKSFAVNAVDTTGHQASQAVSYSVSYDVCQLYESTRVGTTGSTIPLKLRLCDAASVNRSSAGIVVKAIQLKKQGTSQIIDLGLGSNFTFDATIGGTGGGYVFNVITKGLSAGTYSLIFKAGNDPMTHE